MASVFDVFNRDTFALHRATSPTSGHFDSNDKWVAATVATTTIKGHITTVDRMNRESMWQNGQQGVQEDGSMRFFSETLLEKGDVISADQEGGLVFRYRIMAFVRPMRLMARFTGGAVRYEYVIAEVPR